MVQYRMMCSQCNKKVKFPEKYIGKVIKCPDCQNSIRLEVPPGEPVSEGAEEVQGEQEEPGRKRTLPVRMRANKVIEGKLCAGCSSEIHLGDEVYNCPDCDSSMHLDCYEKAGSCASKSCRSKAAAPSAGPVAVSEGDQIPAGHIPCKFCGEAIREGARKCRFCGEFQSQAERRVRKNRRRSSVDDEKLSVIEILICIFCSGIACIVGLIYVIQGKKKGWKMILISLIAALVWTLIRFAIEGGQM